MARMGLFPRGEIVVGYALSTFHATSNGAVSNKERPLHSTVNLVPAAGESKRYVHGLGVLGMRLVVSGKSMTEWGQ